MPRSARYAVLLLCSFATIFTAIYLRVPKWLADFDQSFYLTIAYDIVHHGVFSNGVFDAVDSTVAVPPSGMFFSPLYPAIVATAMRLDRRFSRAVDCAIETANGKGDHTACEIYVGPMHVVHALFLALGVVFIGAAATRMFNDATILFGSGALATAALVADVDVFSFLMTESLNFCLFSACLFLLLRAWTSGKLADFAALGLASGLLCLSKPSFYVVLGVFGLITLSAGRVFARNAPRRDLRFAVVFTLCALLVVSPWIARNYISVGKLGVSEEYGSAVLIERFAYNRMSAHEFGWAFLYCVPAIGPSLVTSLAGPDAMRRFQYDSPGSFFNEGQARRFALIKEHGRLDPIIGGLFRAEWRESWWRHLATSIPLSYCGMWAGGALALLLVPMFWLALLLMPRRQRVLLAVMAAAPFVMLGMHGLLGNQYTRYNLALIGPFAIAGAWGLRRLAASMVSRRAVGTRHGRSD